MVQQPGTRLGSYQIISAIGSGGMGQVYRARDTNLQRDVALKLLPAGFASDADRVARFDREAQTLAALNHPNIAQVFGIEGRGTDPCIVMELVEGEDLAERIARGPMPVDEVLPAARQIAEALEAAHELGIVHRDLKPANIRIRPDGVAKVLDFGLAKPSQIVPAVGRTAAESPTVTSPAQMTVAGSLLGTAAYMSPEQARGRAVDKRADIWAFGCVLFEMLTGQRAFGGDTVTDTLAAVMKDAVPFERLPASTPDAVRQLIARCLERDPRSRLRDIGEARIALANASIAPPTRTGRSAGWIPWIVAGAGVALAALFGAIGWRADSAPEMPVRRFELPIEIANASLSRLSPDGNRVAYVVDGNVKVRPLDSLTSIDLGPVALGASMLMWSPDSRAIAFAAGGALRSVPAAGGPIFTICKVPATGRALSGAWRTDGTIVLSVWREHVYVVPASGGEPRVLVQLDPQVAIDVHTVSAMPDNRLLLQVHSAADADEFTYELFDGTSRTALIRDRDVRDVTFAPPHHLLLTRRGSNAGVWALAFSEGPLDVSKATLIEPNATSADAVRDGSMLVGFAARGVPNSELVWVERTTKKMTKLPGAAIELATPGSMTLLTSFALSPEGKRLAFVNGLPPEIFVRDLQSGVDARLTFEQSFVAYPAWFPRGDRLLYVRGQATAGNQISMKNADGSGTSIDLVTGSFARMAPNGRTLLYLGGDIGNLKLRTAAVRADGTLGPSQPVFPANADPSVVWFDVSPDGTLLTYQVRQPNQRFDVFLTEFPQASSRWAVASDAMQPQFTKDGREIVYVTGSSISGVPTGYVAAIPVTPRSAVKLGQVATLFELDGSTDQERAVRPGSQSGFAVSRDGARFLMARNLETARRRAAITQNWMAALPTPR